MKTLNLIKSTTLRFLLSALIGLVMCLTLIGCDQIPVSFADQCLRQELFEKCMQSLPEGPGETVYNDWDEVVSECGSQAYSSAQRNPKYIKPECRPSGT